MAEEKKGFFRRLAEGLSKTRDNIVSGMDAIFNGFSDIDDDFYDEIEEILVMGDIGINATTSIIENLKRKVKEAFFVPSEAEASKSANTPSPLLTAFSVPCAPVISLPARMHRPNMA